jgi:cytochrome c553
MMERRRSPKVLAALLLAAGTAACSAAPEQGIARGEELFDTCLPCHGTNGGGNQTLGAPSIAGLPQWYLENQLRSFQAAWRGGTAFDTVGIRMKSMSLTLDLEGDLESVAEYVASLAPAIPDDLLTGDEEAGRTTYQTCVACHGVDGGGVQALNAPPLRNQSDWYMVAQLRKFRSGWRGANPQDVTGATMRPNAMLLDEDGIQNVVAYIETLR